MNFKRIILIVAVVHLVVIAGFFMRDLPSANDASQPALAGAVWSNQDPDAEQPTVDASSASLLDPRAADLTGYNAGDRLLAVNTQSDRPRYSPTRPSSSSIKPSSSETTLKPVGRPGQAKPATNKLPSTISYTVQSGDSLWGIAQRFDVTLKDLERANPGISIGVLQVGVVLNVPRSGQSFSAAPGASVANAPPVTTVDGAAYVVKAGDSLSRIAATQGSTVTALKLANGLKDDRIRVGQKLVIPQLSSSSQLAERQHNGPKVVMKPGDSLSKIAARYNVSVTALMTYNKIGDASRIPVGKTILIPVAPEPAPEPKPQPVVQPQAPAPNPPVAEPTRVEPLSSQEVDDIFANEDLIQQPVIQIEE